MRLRKTVLQSSFYGEGAVTVSFPVIGNKLNEWQNGFVCSGNRQGCSPFAFDFNSKWLDGVEVQSTEQETHFYRCQHTGQFLEPWSCCLLVLEATLWKEKKGFSSSGRFCCYFPGAETSSVSFPVVRDPWTSRFHMDEGRSFRNLRPKPWVIRCSNELQRFWGFWNYLIGLL